MDSNLSPAFGIMLAPQTLGIIPQTFRKKSTYQQFRLSTNILKPQNSLAAACGQGVVIYRQVFEVSIRQCQPYGL